MPELLAEDIIIRGPSESFGHWALTGLLADTSHEELITALALAERKEGE